MRARFSHIIVGQLHSETYQNQNRFRQLSASVPGKLLEVHRNERASGLASAFRCMPVIGHAAMDCNV